MIWYTFETEKVMIEIITNDIAAFKTAESLETALVNQKGLVSYYYMDNDPNWLKQLGGYRQIFQEQLVQAYSLTKTEEQHNLLEAIEADYNLYIEIKDKVISFYQNHENEAGKLLQPQTRELFFRILKNCEQYKEIHKMKIEQALTETRKEASRLRWAAGIGISLFLGFTMILAYILILNILQPVQKLIREADQEGLSKNENEISALSRSVYGLIEDAVQTQEALNKSQKSLMEAEKMAIVGKLAAATAHSIRNPLTSVKMRLFSLNRSLNLTNLQQDDFEVISLEIRHIDNILQNFLEFSRPPALKLKKMSPSQVVDTALQILSHRLKFHNADVNVIREKPLSEEILIDPEQFKEVLDNLLINACEAMEKGGQITIREEETQRFQNRYAVIHITDSGPGIPDHIRDKIFEPFFTTKEEGTGLGLSIVSRIISEHKGWIEASSGHNRGASFSIFLPIKE